MATFYLDFENGNDSNNGSTWALAWKTVANGATAARTAPGDTIRIAKSPAPVSVGDGKWVKQNRNGGGFPSTLNISATASNGGAVRLTISSTTTLATGDIVTVRGIVGTVEANGNWKITVDNATQITLVNSVYANAWSSGGTVQQVNSKSIILTTPQTQNITNCEVIWTNAAGGDCTASLVAGTDMKISWGAARLTMDASPQTSTLQAYFPTGTLDLSAYQELTFWMKNSAAITTATTWTISLCSDTAGATVVDTFVIPAIASVNRYIPFSIARTGGGNLGSSIQSIAVSTGSTAPANSSWIQLDNISASKSNNLSLRSLISKTSTEQGGSWYPIQNISADGTIILVDNGTNTLGNAGNGYYEESETVTTYIRNTVRMATVGTASTTLMNDVKESGTAIAYMNYLAGFDTSTSTQTGETWLDGWNGFGVGFNVNGINYTKLDRLNFTRFWFPAYYRGNSTGSIIGNIAFSGCSYGWYGDACVGLYAENIEASVNNDNEGIYAADSFGLTFKRIGNLSNNLTNGIRCLTTTRNVNILTLVQACCNNEAINGSNSSYIRVGGSPIIAYNASSGVTGSAATIYLTNGLFTANGTLGTSHVGNPAGFSNHYNYFTNYNQTAYSLMTADGGKIESEASTLTNGSGTQWKFTTQSNTNRRTEFPLSLSVAKVACVASKLVTVKCWFKKGHATNIGARLVFNSQLGAAESIATCPSDTSENELTVTFTPTYAGVAEVTAEAFYVAGHSTVIIDSVTVTQAA